MGSEMCIRDRVSASGADTAANVADRPLADGDYVASIPAGSIADAAGNVLAEDATLNFWVLSGDVNRDRVVNIFDFFAARSNVGDTAGLFSTGDANYDGVVNLFDLFTVRRNFGRAL